MHMGVFNSQSLSISSLASCRLHVLNMLRMLMLRGLRLKPLSKLVIGARQGPHLQLRYGSQHQNGEEPAVLFNVDPHTSVGTITLNNPRRRNPLSFSTLQQLKSILDTVVAGQQTTERVRVLVIQSTGSVFSSGHDFKEFTADTGADYHKTVLNLCTEVNMMLQMQCPPVIAAIDGLATAAGCQLACSCDIIYATSTSTFCVPGSRNGGFCHTPGVALSNKIHPKKALEMLLLAEDIDANEAYRIGLVNRVTEKDTLQEITRASAEKIALTSAYNTQQGKRAFYEHVSQGDLASKYKVAQRYMLDMFLSNDQQEGISAFFGKRKPTWTDS
eukprot:m.137330 g.137330  ORF g.137330 m.137330 type:complete len:330 (-) comp29914_c0_seq5:200-1189(-)